MPSYVVVTFLFDLYSSLMMQEGYHHLPLKDDGNDSLMGED